MEETSRRTVKVGELTIELARFRGFKAQRIMREASKIGRAYPEISARAAEFERAYTEDNALRLSRPEAEMRYGEDAREISEQAWEASGGVLALKQVPSAWERLGAIWPELMDVAEREVGNLLAVSSLSNEELEEADNADRVEEAIAERRKELMHRGEVEELFDLARAAYEVAREQFAPLVATLAPLLSRIGLEMTTDTREPTTSGTSPTPETETEEEDAPASPSPPSSSETKGSSSTDSPPPTDGTEQPSSIERPGRPSELSPTG